jgi:hypothetical protein
MVVLLNLRNHENTMPLTYKDWHEREAGHGTDLQAEDHLYDAYEAVAKIWSVRTNGQAKFDYYFLETPHKASIYLYTSEYPAVEVAEEITTVMYQKGYDRVDIEVFGQQHAILTLPDPWKN